MRLLILGWDGADWDLIDPLLDSGALPHLACLLARGCRAPLASLEPRLSPLLWTSVVTGVTPDRHGILNFVEPAPDGQGLRLASSTSRRCRALWNLLQLSGLSSHVVNWYATHPAEPINGVVLSNQFFQASEPPAQSLHPAVQHSEWLQARQAAVGAAAAAAATRARILPDPGLIKQPEDKALSSCMGRSSHSLTWPSRSRISSFSCAPPWPATSQPCATRQLVPGPKPSSPWGGRACGWCCRLWCGRLLCRGLTQTWRHCHHWAEADPAATAARLAG